MREEGEKRGREIEKRGRKREEAGKADVRIGEREGALESNKRERNERDAEG